MFKQTQKDLIIKYLEDHGEIRPSVMGGRVFDGIMFGSQISARCSELYKKGVLRLKRKDGRFHVYELNTWKSETNKGDVLTTENLKDAFNGYKKRNAPLFDFIEF